jgi:hypothetical protein
MDTINALTTLIPLVSEPIKALVPAVRKRASGVMARIGEDNWPTGLQARDYEAMVLAVTIVTFKNERASGVSRELEFDLPDGSLPRDGMCLQVMADMAPHVRCALLVVALALTSGQRELARSFIRDFLRVDVVLQDQLVGHFGLSRAMRLIGMLTVWGDFLLADLTRMLQRRGFPIDLSGPSNNKLGNMLRKAFINQQDLEEEVVRTDCRSARYLGLVAPVPGHGLLDLVELLTHGRHISSSGIAARALAERSRWLQLQPSWLDVLNDWASIGPRVVGQLEEAGRKRKCKRRFGRHLCPVGGCVAEANKIIVVGLSLDAVLERLPAGVAPSLVAEDFYVLLGDRWENKISRLDVIEILKKGLLRLFPGATAGVMDGILFLPCWPHGKVDNALSWLGTVAIDSGDSGPCEPSAGTKWVNSKEVSSYRSKPELYTDTTPPGWHAKFQVFAGHVYHRVIRGVVDIGLVPYCDSAPLAVGEPLYHPDDDDSMSETESTSGEEEAVAHDITGVQSLAEVLKYRPKLKAATAVHGNEPMRRLVASLCMWHLNCSWENLQFMRREDGKVHAFKKHYIDDAVDDEVKTMQTRSDDGQLHIEAYQVSR